MRIGCKRPLRPFFADFARKICDYSGILPNLPGSRAYRSHDRLAAGGPPKLFQPEELHDPATTAIAQFRQALNAGEIRAAEPDPVQPGGWRVNGWVKKGILLGFRIGSIVDMSIDPNRQPFFDKSTYPVHKFSPADGVRIVPGGSSIRDGCYIGKGVTCMPPMYINAGAYVSDGTMVDSHALVGSCAQMTDF